MRAKNFVTFLAVALLMVVGTVANAQRINREVLTKSTTIPSAERKTEPITPIRSENIILGATNNKIIAGSWLETVTFNGPMPPLKSLVTFNADGSVLVADQGAVGSATAFSAGHGSWSHAGGRSFDWTTVELLYATADGSLIGYLKVSGRYTVNETGNAYTGQFLATISDPDGNVLFTGDGTNAGNRIQVEPIP